MSSVCPSYVLVCHLYVTRMYSYVICMSPVCTRISSVSQLVVSHLYVTRMYSYVTRMSLVCTRMNHTHGLFQLYQSIQSKQPWTIKNCINFTFTTLVFVDTCLKIFLVVTRPLKGEDVHICYWKFVESDMILTPFSYGHPKEPQIRGWNILDFIVFNIQKCFNLLQKM